MMPSAGSFRPWATALATGVLATTVGTQTDITLWAQPAATFVLMFVRQALGGMWAVYVALRVGQAAVVFMQRRARLGASAGPISALRAAVHRSEGAHGPLALSQVVDRAILITGLTFPRFLNDLPAGLPMAFWLVVLLTCGALVLNSVLPPQHYRWYWCATASAIALWGIGSILSPSGFWYPD